MDEQDAFDAYKEGLAIQAMEAENALIEAAGGTGLYVKHAIVNDQRIAAAEARQLDPRGVHLRGSITTEERN